MAFVSWSISIRNGRPLSVRRTIDQVGTPEFRLLGFFEQHLKRGDVFGHAWAVRGQPEAVKLSLLAFTAGVLVTVVVEGIVPEAHEGDESRLATALFIAGFALFSVLSAYLG